MQSPFSAAIADRPLRPFQWLVIGAALAVLVIEGIDLQSLPILTPLILEDWGIDRALFGPALAAALFGMAFGSSLGGWPFFVFFHVTLPLILPAVVAGAIFAFATSFDEVVVTLFLAGPEQATLPRQMFSGIRENRSPTIAAAATLLIGFSIVLLLVLEWLRGRSERLRTSMPE